MGVTCFTWKLHHSLALGHHVVSRLVAGRPPRGRAAMATPRRAVLAAAQPHPHQQQEQLESSCASQPGHHPRTPTPSGSCSLHPSRRRADTRDSGVSPLCRNASQTR